jgi:hypothetical protein
MSYANHSANEMKLLKLQATLDDIFERDSITCDTISEVKKNC